VAQKTVLILDDDLGFSMWLGRALNEAGIRALPACSGEEARAIIADAGMGAVDLMIANFNLDGCREVLDSLSAQGGRCKLICIGGAGDRTVDGALQRPRGKTLPAAERYIRTVRSVLGVES